MINTRHGHDEIFTDEELCYWLAFDQLSGPGLGPKSLRSLFEGEYSLKPLWHASASELRQRQQLSEETIRAFIEKRGSIDPESLLAPLKQLGVRAYPLLHPDYPTYLREISQPPLVLYMLGNLSAQDLLYSLAVVGTRKPSGYGQRLAKEFARELSAAGATIISGMAVGVDSLAHWGAIEGGGKTVAVLACGVDQCYPSSNRPLYNKLVSGESGAVVSEFYPGTKPEKWRFPARNRIISGLSQGVVVIEAGETSGSLITANIGFEQNRTIFAIPGRIDSATSVGTNNLIADDKAHLVVSPEHIFKRMAWTAGLAAGREVATVVELMGREREVFDLITSEPDRNSDDGIRPVRSGQRTGHRQADSLLVRPPGRGQHHEKRAELLSA